MITPLKKLLLIDEYGGDDDLAVADNNTSCFNYRVVAGSTKLSRHALGLAIDINPFYNPYVTYPDGVKHSSPPGSEPYADRSVDFPYKIGGKDDLCLQLFGRPRLYLGRALEERAGLSAFSEIRASQAYPKSDQNNGKIH